MSATQKFKNKANAVTFVGTLGFTEFVCASGNNRFYYTNPAVPRNVHGGLVSSITVEKYAGKWEVWLSDKNAALVNKLT